MPPENNAKSENIMPIRQSSERMVRLHLDDLKAMRNQRVKRLFKRRMAKLYSCKQNNKKRGRREA
jgi:hypothetical protein